MTMTTQVLTGFIATASLFVAGCSQQQPPAADTSSQAAPAPEQAHGDATLQADTNGDTLTAKLTAVGIPVTYTAHFDGDKLTRIDEIRTADGRHGEYEFYGARLIKYSGAATASAATLSLEFDMQGAVQSAQADPSPFANSETSAIRERAQLLRSHALVQRATRAHSQSEPTLSAR